jgi:hypothetical protein
VGQVAVASLLALPIFIVGGFGFRLVALPGLWRALRRPAGEAPIWVLLAWTAMAAFAQSEFIVSVPYHETTQIHQFALFMLAPFVGRSLAAWPARRTRILLSAPVIAVAVPSPLHYVHRKWNDAQRPFADVSHEERMLAEVLRRTDPDSTTILHGRPSRGTFVGILAERRSVLAWADYVRGAEDRRQDVDAFFASADMRASDARAILARLGPTHVVEYLGRDRINGEVLGQLSPLFRTRQLALYAVPEALRHP